MTRSNVRQSFACQPTMHGTPESVDFVKKKQKTNQHIASDRILAHKDERSRTPWALASREGKCWAGEKLTQRAEALACSSMDRSGEPVSSDWHGADLHYHGCTPKKRELSIFAPGPPPCKNRHNIVIIAPLAAECDGWKQTSRMRFCAHA